MPKQEYSREDARRMLGISEQQLRGWERQGLVRGGEALSFKDLIGLRTLLKLRESRISTQKIGLAVASLKRKIAGVEYPLSELKFLPEERRLAVQIAGQKMEAISGQILLDFDTTEPRGVKTFPTETPASRANLSEANSGSSASGNGGAGRAHRADHRGISKSAAESVPPPG